MDGRPQALDALDWPIWATAVRMILQVSFSRDTPRRGINRPALVGRRRGVSRARRRKLLPREFADEPGQFHPGARKAATSLFLKPPKGKVSAGCLMASMP